MQQLAESSASSADNGIDRVQAMRQLGAKLAELRKGLEELLALHADPAEAKQWKQELAEHFLQEKEYDIEAQYMMLERWKKRQIGMLPIEFLHATADWLINHEHLSVCHAVS